MSDDEIIENEALWAEENPRQQMWEIGRCAR